MTTTADVTITRHEHSTVYSTDEITGIATVRYQGGGWIVRREISPDEFTSQRVATREYAESLALRHALRIAA
jgi:hypothetical protein